MDCQNGISRYEIRGRETNVEHHFVAQPDAAKTYASGFSFDLDPDWKANVPSRRWPARDRVDMLMEVKFEHESGDPGTIELTTMADRSQANVGKVDWMNLLWGCLRKDTRVLMADGSQRPVESVRVGDLVQQRRSGRRCRSERRGEGLRGEPRGVQHGGRAPARVLAQPSPGHKARERCRPSRCAATAACTARAARRSC